MGYKKYTDEFKEKVVKEYYDGARRGDLLAKYDVPIGTFQKWVKKWREHKCFPDKRGKRGKGKVIKPKTHKRKEMTDQEYIEYLEMHLEIKKYMAFYEKRKQK